MISGESYFSIKTSSSQYQDLLNALKECSWISSYAVWVIGGDALFRTWSATNFRVSVMKAFLKPYDDSVVPQCLLSDTESVLLHLQCCLIRSENHIPDAFLDQSSRFGSTPLSLTSGQAEVQRLEGFTFRTFAFRFYRLKTWLMLSLEPRSRVRVTARKRPRAKVKGKRSRGRLEDKVKGKGESKGEGNVMENFEVSVVCLDGFDALLKFH